MTPAQLAASRTLAETRFMTWIAKGCEWPQPELPRSLIDRGWIYLEEDGEDPMLTDLGLAVELAGRGDL